MLGHFIQLANKSLKKVSLRSSGSTPDSTGTRAVPWGHPQWCEATANLVDLEAPGISELPSILLKASSGCVCQPCLNGRKAWRGGWVGRAAAEGQVLSHNHKLLSLTFSWISLIPMLKIGPTVTNAHVSFSLLTISSQALSSLAMVI